ncbi:pentatricopeptide repeat domain-containing protein [Spizellomyces punctatus DAOM BR117]|uniref:Pentatricopeptide repeat domain-containing protein n=1 Tax=Spizellomyces punctatus (strain DAOM BR117) TaxID=645134 RepID=A0A0L0HS78_SPIPD|nr:pentatricopeptide repeat domain-containing protein [Spizellomyces punctatus DAOM BR117]KND04211.1 pentatricopeptide repeat domain-containing protein [Spizellomyces punctatus DAOM BR117]|eukprot:XP_016612250.1 pentatricopeptide repeat domain-containing protein [Spizellomyces punctatus DAOM BR117]
MFFITFRPKICAPIVCRSIGTIGLAPNAHFLRLSNTPICNIPRVTVVFGVGLKKNSTVINRSLVTGGEKTISSAEVPTAVGTELIVAFRSNLEAKAAVQAWELYTVLRADRSSSAFRSLNNDDFQELSNLLRSHHIRHLSSNDVESLLSDMEFLGIPPTRYQYNWLLKCYVDAADLDRSLQTLRNMAVAGCPPSLGSYIYVVRCCLKNKDAATAQSILKRMIQRARRSQIAVPANMTEYAAGISDGGSGPVPDTELMSLSMMTALVAEDWFITQSIYEEAEQLGIQLDTPILLRAFKTFIRKSTQGGPYIAKPAFQRAFDMYNRLIQTDTKIDTGAEVDMLIEGLARLERLDDAIQVLDKSKMLQMRLDARSYGLVIDRCLKQRKGQTALRIYGDMKDMAVIPNVETFNNLLTYLRDQTDDDAYEKLKSLYADMQIVGVTGDAYTYAILTGSSMARNDSAAILRFCQDLRDSRQLTETTYNELITWAAHQQDLPLLKLLLHNLQDAGYSLNMATSKRVIQAYINDGDILSAEQHVRQMINDRTLPLQIAELFIRHSIEQGQAKIAVEVVDSLLASGMEVPLAVQIRLLPHLVNAGRVQNALSIHASVVGDGIHIGKSELQNFLTALLAQGYRSETFAIMKQLLEIGRSVDGETCNHLIRTCVDAGELDLAKRTVQELMQEAPIDVELYDRIVDGFLAQDKVDDIVDLYEATGGMGLKKREGHKYPRRVRLAAKTFSDIRNNLARRTEEFIKKNALYPVHLEGTVVRVKAVLDTAADVHESDRCGIDAMYHHQLKLLRKPFIDRIEAEAATASEGGAERAKAVLHEMRAAIRPDAHAYGLVMNSYAALEKWDQVLQLKDDMIEGRITENATTRSLTLRALLGKDQITKARIYCLECLKAGWYPDNGEPDVLVARLLGRGELEKALEVSQAILDTSGRTAKMYDRTIYLKNSLGDIEGALGTFEQMKRWREEEVSQDAREFCTLHGSTVTALMHACLLEQRTSAIHELLTEISGHVTAFDQRFYLNLAMRMYRAHRPALSALLLRHSVAASHDLSVPAYTMIMTALERERDCLTAWKLYKFAFVEWRCLNDPQLERWSLDVIERLCMSSRDKDVPSIRRELSAWKNGDPPISKALSFENLEHDDVDRSIRSIEFNFKDGEPKTIFEKHAKDLLPGQLERDDGTAFVEQPDVADTTAALITALENKKYEEAGSIFCKLENASESIPPFLLWKLALGVLNRPELKGGRDLLKKVLKAMMKSPSGLPCLQSQVKTLALKSHHVTIARIAWILEMIGEVKLADDLLSMAITRVSEDKDVRNAVKMTRILVAAGRPVPPALTDIFIRAVVQDLSDQKFEVIMRRVINAGIPFDEDMFCRLVEIYVMEEGNALEVTELERALEQLRRTGIKCGSLSLQTLLKVCHRALDVAGAQKAWARWVKEGVVPESLCYQLLFDLLVRTDDIAGATNMRKIMNSMGIPPRPEYLREYFEKYLNDDHMTLETAIQVVKDVIADWEKADKPMPPPVSLRTVGNILKKAAIAKDHGGIRVAYDLVFELGYRRERLRPFLLDMVANFKSEGNLDAAGQLYRSVGPTRKLVWDTKVHEILLKYWSELGEFRKMEEVYLAIKEANKLPVLQPETFDEIIQRHARRGTPRDLQVARRFFNDLTQELERLPSRKALETLVEEHARSWDQDSAEMYIGVMKTTKILPTIVQYNHIMEGWGQMGRTDRAERWMDQIQHDGLNPDRNTWFGLCWAYVMAKDLPGAEKVLMRTKQHGFEIVERDLLTKLGERAQTLDVPGAKSVWEELVLPLKANDTQVPDIGDTRFGRKPRKTLLIGTGGDMYPRRSLDKEHPRLERRPWMKSLTGTDPEGETGLLPPDRLLGKESRAHEAGLVPPKQRIPKKLRHPRGNK